MSKKAKSQTRTKKSPSKSPQFPTTLHQVLENMALKSPPSQPSNSPTDSTQTALDHQTIPLSPVARCTCQPNAQSSSLSSDGYSKEISSDAVGTRQFLPTQILSLNSSTYSDSEESPVPCLRERLLTRKENPDHLNNKKDKGDGLIQTTLFSACRSVRSTPTQPLSPSSDTQFQSNSLSLAENKSTLSTPEKLRESPCSLPRSPTRQITGARKLKHCHSREKLALTQTTDITHFPPKTPSKELATNECKKLCHSSPEEADTLTGNRDPRLSLCHSPKKLALADETDTVYCRPVEESIVVDNLSFETDVKSLHSDKLLSDSCSNFSLKREKSGDVLTAKGTKHDPIVIM